jgi:hypothetical protein
VIDTTGLAASMLRRKVANELLELEAPGRMAVTAPGKVGERVMSLLEYRLPQHVAGGRPIS